MKESEIMKFYGSLSDNELIERIEKKVGHLDFARAELGRRSKMESTLSKEESPEGKHAEEMYLNNNISKESMKKCPFCAEHIENNCEVCPICNEKLKSSDIKKCPFCAEDIKSESIKCRHCGEMLNANTKLKNPNKSFQSNHQGQRKNPQTSSRNTLYIIAFFVLLFLIAIVKSYVDSSVSTTRNQMEYEQRVQRYDDIRFRRLGR